MKKILYILGITLLFSCSSSDSNISPTPTLNSSYSVNMQALGMNLTERPPFTADNITFYNYCNWYEIKNGSTIIGYGIFLELNKSTGVKGADLYVEINSPTLISGTTYDLTSSGTEITFPVNDGYSLNPVVSVIKSVTISTITDNKISGSVNIGMRKNLSPFPEFILTGTFTNIPKMN